MFSLSFQKGNCQEYRPPRYAHGRMQQYTQFDFQLVKVMLLELTKPNWWFSSVYVLSKVKINWEC